MLTITRDRIELTEIPEGVQRDLLDSYIQQHNLAQETYGWMRDLKLLNLLEVRTWDRLLAGLARVCRALDAGFDPWQPPDWHHGPLRAYYAPIPGPVREATERAIPIFGLEAIQVYDPNPAHFVTPKTRDPLVLGQVSLVDQDVHFLIGQWDIPADMKFVEGTPRQDVERAREAGHIFNSDFTDLVLRSHLMLGAQQQQPVIPATYVERRRAVSTPKWEAGIHSNLMSSLGIEKAWTTAISGQTKRWTP